jgi:hypothetical protein
MFDDPTPACRYAIKASPDCANCFRGIVPYADARDIVVSDLVNFEQPADLTSS